MLLYLVIDQVLESGDCTFENLEYLPSLGIWGKYLSTKAQVAVGDVQAYILQHIWPPVISGDELQSFEMAWVSGYLGVMTEQDYPAVEIRGVWDVDAAAVVEEAIMFRPFCGLEGVAGRLLQFLRGLGDGFFLWLLSSLSDVLQDVLFWSGKLQAL